MKPRKEISGSSFYNSFYVSRDKTIKEFYDSGDEHSLLTERKLSFQNIGLNYNYFHLINLPLKNKKLQRLYENQPYALFVISKPDDNLSKFMKAIKEFVEQNICCFVYIKSNFGVKKRFKIFSSSNDVVLINNLSGEDYLPLIHKVDYIVLNEYEDCLDAVLMEKKIVLVENLSGNKMGWKTKIRDSRRLRGICLYFFLSQLSTPGINDDIYRVTDIDMLLQFGHSTPNSNSSNSEWRYRFKKRILKFKRDPKRFFLDSRFLILRSIGCFL